MIASAHDVSEGGLFISLLESAMYRNLGFEIETDIDIRKDAYLFGESQGRVVVSVEPKNEDAFIEYMTKSKAVFTLLGTVRGKEIIIDGESFGKVSDYKKANDNVIDEIMKVK